MGGTVSALNRKLKKMDLGVYPKSIFYLGRDQ